MPFLLYLWGNPVRYREQTVGLPFLWLIFSHSWRRVRSKSSQTSQVRSKIPGYTSQILSSMHQTGRVWSCDTKVSNNIFHLGQRAQQQWRKVFKASNRWLYSRTSQVQSYVPWIREKKKKGSLQHSPATLRQCWHVENGWDVWSRVDRFLPSHWFLF